MNNSLIPLIPTKTEDCIFEKLESENSNRIKSLVLRKLIYGNCRSPEMHGEEVVQEVFLKVSQHHTEIKTNAKAWISTIAIRKTLDHLYKCSDETKHEVELDDTENGQWQHFVVSDFYLLIEYRDIIKKFCSKLKEPERTLFRMILELKDSSEIGMLMGISEGTVRTRKSRLFEKLEVFKKENGIYF